MEILLSEDQSLCLQIQQVFNVLESKHGDLQDDTYAEKFITCLAEKLKKINDALCFWKSCGAEMFILTQWMSSSNDAPLRNFSLKLLSECVTGNETLVPFAENIFSKFIEKASMRYSCF